MRSATLALSLLTAPLADLAGQTPLPPQAIFGDVVQRFAAELHLSPLSAGVPLGILELRIWEGFGLTGVRLYQIHREGGHWSARRFYPVDHPDRIETEPLDESLPWAVRWSEAEAAGIWELTPSPARPSDYVPRDDGWSVVVEAAEGPRYNISGSDNPDYACTADDQRLLTVVQALLPTLTRSCQD